MIEPEPARTPREAAELAVRQLTANPFSLLHYGPAIHAESRRCPGIVLVISGTGGLHGVCKRRSGQEKRFWEPEAAARYFDKAIHVEARLNNRPGFLGFPPFLEYEAYNGARYRLSLAFRDTYREMHTRYVGQEDWTWWVDGQTVRVARDSQGFHLAEDRETRMWEPDHEELTRA